MVLFSLISKTFVNLFLAFSNLSNSLWSGYAESSSESDRRTDASLPRPQATCSLRAPGSLLFSTMNNDKLWLLRIKIHTITIY